MKYEKVNLKELITIKNGKDHKALKDGIYPVYGSGGIMRYVEKYLYNKESVLLPRKGTLNNIQYADKPFWTVDTCYYTEVNTDKVIPYFLYRNLRQFDIEALNTGSAVPSMTFDKYYSIQVALPDLEKQQKIVDILKPYDNLIENNRKQMKLLEEVAQRLYKEWFVDLHFPGYEDAEIVDGVPEGWHKTTVTELIDVKYGKDHKKLEDGNTPVYGSGGIMRKIKPVLYSGESVLIPRKGSLNNIMYVSGDFWTIDTMFYSVPKMENIAKYTYHFLKGLDMYSYNIGAAVPSMTIKILSGMAMLCPTEDVLQDFENLLTPIYCKITNLQNTIALLVQARDRLLPKLMSGEIEV